MGLSVHDKDCIMMSRTEPTALGWPTGCNDSQEMGLSVLDVVLHDDDDNHGW